MTQSKDTWLALDQQVCFPLYAATNMLQKLYQPLLQPLGLTYTKYLVMMVLWEAERQSTEVTVGDLQTCLYLDVATMSPLLKRMEKLGFIVRRRSRSDERKVMITLTVMGIELRERACTIPEQLVTKLEVNLESLISFRQEAQSLVETLATKLRET